MPVLVLVDAGGPAAAATPQYSHESQNHQPSQESHQINLVEMKRAGCAKQPAPKRCGAEIRQHTYFVDFSVGLEVAAPPPPPDDFDPLGDDLLVSPQPMVVAARNPATNAIASNFFTVEPSFPNGCQTLSPGAPNYRV